MANKGIIAFIADVHSNQEALKATLADIISKNIRRIINLGDLVGYNANPNECVYIARRHGIESIMGNHDAIVCGLEQPPVDFKPIALEAAKWTQNELREDVRNYLHGLPSTISLNGDDTLYVRGVHGAATHRDTYILDWGQAHKELIYLAENADEKNPNPHLLMFAHSHIRKVFRLGQNHTLTSELKVDNKAPRVIDIIEGNHYAINGGSVGQPRDGDPRASYAILDYGQRKVYLVDVEYDWKTAAAKIEQSDLPSKLAQRLRDGGLKNSY